MNGKEIRNALELDNMWRWKWRYIFLVVVVVGCEQQPVAQEGKDEVSLKGDIYL